MKKIIVSIMLFLSCMSFGEMIRLASFNAMRLGESEKDYESFSHIISKFDIIALEEVMNKEGLDEIVKRLNGKYTYCMSTAVGTKKYKEYYAIMYRKDKVDEVKDVGKYHELKNEFIREPSAFYVKSNKLDMLLIPVHSIFGSNPKMRAAEASRYPLVYKYFYDKTKQDDIIFLGDFNLPSNDPAFDGLKNLGYTNILDPTVDKTTMSKSGPASAYDNIFLMLNNTKAFMRKYGVYNFTYNNNYEQVRKYISDHFLVFIELDNSED